MSAITAAAPVLTADDQRVTRSFTTVRQLTAALASIVGDCGDDDVPVLDHLLQCGALLAARHPDDLELQAAGLVHDLASAARFGARDEDHARASADLVAPLLGPRVARLVAGHVDAKRFLVTMDPSCPLSADSRATLVRQGGPMDRTERARFEADPDHAALVALRRADDDAKVPGAVVPTVASWCQVLVIVAGRRTAG